MATTRVPAPPSLNDINLAASEVNEAVSFGAEVRPTTVVNGANVWRVVKVRHLSADENRGKHNVYVRATDGSGARVRDERLRVVWTWQGRQLDQEARPAALDKGDADFGHGDIPLEKGVHAEIWLEGDGVQSDHVVNLHTDIAAGEKASDGSDGNTLFHHSYLVVFQRQVAQAIPVTKPVEPAPVKPKPVEPTPVQPPPVQPPVTVPEVPVTAFRFETWPTVKRFVNQYFNENPDLYASAHLPGHEGIDLAANEGDPIYAVAAGKVHFVQPFDDGKPYGIQVRIDHVGGYQTIYAHLVKTELQIDQSVEAGQQIGLAGETGRAFGAHLHLTLKKSGAQTAGYPASIIDPLPFLLAVT